jgi:hypothetical protein
MGRLKGCPDVREDRWNFGWLSVSDRIASLQNSAQSEIKVSKVCRMRVMRGMVWRC